MNISGEMNKCKTYLLNYTDSFIYLYFHLFMLYMYSAFIYFRMYFIGIFINLFNIIHPSIHLRPLIRYRVAGGAAPAV